MQTLWVALSDDARRLFDYYKSRDFKLVKTTDTAYMFANKECDMTTNETYLETTTFAFWLNKTEVKKLDKPGII